MFPSPFNAHKHEGVFFDDVDIRFFVPLGQDVGRKMNALTAQVPSGTWAGNGTHIFYPHFVPKGTRERKYYFIQCLVLRS